MRRPRVLLAITVYNGWAFVPRCIRSAQNLSRDHADIDVLILDDASPEPGFSAKLEALCAELGVAYYRTPRNLGIVRNVNMGLLTAIERGYDYVIISNSDVIYSRQCVDLLLDAAVTDPTIGSVTAWSNNVSIYSIPNANPDKHLAEQEVVDWVAASLAGSFRGEAINVPAGISFAILIPTAVLRHVGLMDPVYGRGYCEETDWSLRSLAMGYRVALAPAAFVYHQGRGSTLAAGMVSGAHTTVPANEAIIDHRYPTFRSQVDAFVRGGLLERLHKDATARIVKDAGTQFGYDVRIGRIDPEVSSTRVQVTWSIVGQRPRVHAFYRGFEHLIGAEGAQTPYDAVEAFFGQPPARLAGAHEARFTWTPPAESASRPVYPSRV